MLRTLYPRVTNTLRRSFSTTSSTASMASPFTRAVVSSMRTLYPEVLADKSFDNTGLLLEAPFLPARRNRNSVLLTIDLTRAVADEAIQNSHSVVVAYHPIIFRGLKSLTLEDSQQQSLLRLAANGISVYSPHTAVDIVPGGMADWLCDIVTGKLDAPEPETFTAGAQSPPSEVEVTTSESASESEPDSKPATEPTTPADQHTADPFTSSPTPKKKDNSTRPSLAHRTYSKPSYPRPTSNFHPATISHKRHTISPSPASSLEAANKLTSSSLYTASNTGAGRAITFTTPQPLTLLITRIAHAIGLPKGFPVAIPQSSAVEEIAITTVGICPGAGSSVLRACSPPPDLVFTGEMSHHDALAVTERGGCVVSLFHSNSERGYLWSVMRGKLTSELKTQWERVRAETKAEGREWGDGIEEILEDESIDVVVSERDRDPFGIVVLQESGVEGVEL